MKSHLVCCLLVGVWALGSRAAPVQWPVSEGGNGHYYSHRGEYLIGWNDVAEEVWHGFIVEYDDEDTSNHPPYTPVPVRDSSWGRVKVLFR